MCIGMNPPLPEEVVRAEIEFGMYSHEANRVRAKALHNRWPEKYDEQGRWIGGDA